MTTTKNQIEKFIIAKRNPLTSVEAIKNNSMLHIICMMHEEMYFEIYDENPTVEILTNIVYNRISSFENL